MQELFEISIHAPAKGATSAGTMQTGIIYYFNPRSREGSDTVGNVVQSVFTDFNPRSREGSDRLE